MSQLLTYVMESHPSQSQIIDLTDDEVAELEEAGGPGLAHYNQDRIEYGPSPVLTSQTARPITRYVISSFTGFTLSRHGTRD